MDDDTPQLRRLEVPPPGLAPLCNAALRRGAEVDVFELEISAETAALIDPVYLEAPPLPAPLRALCAEAVRRNGGRPGGACLRPGDTCRWPRCVDGAHLELVSSVRKGSLSDVSKASDSSDL
jgi:hypothetical protein